MINNLCIITLAVLCFYPTTCSAAVATIQGCSLLQAKRVVGVQQVVVNETAQPVKGTARVSALARDAAPPLFFVSLVANVRAASAHILIPEQLWNLVGQVQLWRGRVLDPQGSSNSGDQEYINQDKNNNAVYTFFSMLCFAGLVVIVAIFYDTEKKFPFAPEQGGFKKVADEKWEHELFACMEDTNLCCFSLFCSPVRWADTMRMFGFLPFYGALAVYLGLCILDTMVFGLAGLILLVILTYYRQQIRMRFNMEWGTCGSVFKDCCAYLCCSCCAIVQEARQVEAAWRGKHPAVEEAQKKATEEDARRKAVEDEAARKRAAEEEVRRMTAEEIARKKAADEDALRKKVAEKEEVRSRTAEELARKKAAEEEASCKKAAEKEEARRTAVEVESRKKTAEDAARKNAAEDEVARKKAAEEEETRRRAAEETARKKAAEEDAVRKKVAEEEAARKKAVEEEKTRKNADAAKSASSSKSAKAEKEEDIDFDMFASDSEGSR